MHGIIYTDGGCKTVSGHHYGGYGFHGYLYTPEVAKKGAGHPKGLPTRQGWQLKSQVDKSQAVTLLRYVEGYGTDPNIRTNNIAELLGATEALKYLHEVMQADTVAEHLLEEWQGKKANKNKPMPEVNTTLESLVIKTDSEYVVKGVLKKWVDNDWKTSKGEPVKNQKYWEGLISAIALFPGLTIKFEWVRGHNGDVGNERADLMANLAINHALFEEYVQHHSLHHPDKHWKTDYEHNRLMGTQTWYFNTPNPEPMIAQWDEKYHLYHLGRNDSDDDDHGKRINNNTYAVAALRRPDRVLEMIRQALCQVADPDLEQIAVGRLNNVFTSSVYDRMSHYGKSSLRVNRQTGNIYELGKAEVARILKVPLISYRALDELNDLESLLGRVLMNELGPAESVTDITEVVYEQGFVLNKAITAANPRVSVSVSHRVKGDPKFQTVTMSVGMDLPPRNVLAKLADPTTQVRAITQKTSEEAFRLYTLISTTEGHVLWSGHWTNLTRVR